MEEKREEELLAEEGAKEEVEEPVKERDFDGIYSNIASNRYENLRTSHIENKAKQLRKQRK